MHKQLKMYIVLIYVVMYNYNNKLLESYAFNILYYTQYITLINYYLNGMEIGMSRCMTNTLVFNVFLYFGGIFL